MKKTVIIRGGDDLITDAIICDNVESAKKIIRHEINVNINESGDEEIDMNDDIIVSSYSELNTPISIAADISDIYATISPHEMIEWWVIISDEHIYSDSDYDM